MSPVLRIAPTDLTRLRSSVGDLMRQIDGRNVVRALGEPHRRRTALQKVQMLAEHVYSLQQK